jgi:hypothetical protein
MDNELLKKKITEMLADRNAGGYSRSLWNRAKKEYYRNILKDDSGEEFDLHAEEREAFYWGLESAYQNILELL